MPNETRSNVLPAGYAVRRPSLSDLEPVFAVVDAAAIAEHGASDFSLEDFQSGWLRSDFDLATDAWLVVAPDGQIAAYADVTHRQHAMMDAWVSVHPRHLERGIGTYLMRQTEGHAREHISLAAPQARVVIQRWISTANAPALRLAEREGYAPVRRFLRMLAELGDAIPAPQWPDGITVRTFILGQDEHAVYDAFEASFQDHWGHTTVPFNLWEERMLKRDDFDPALWFLALDGQQVAGFALCRPYIDMGWVDDLGVLRHWRRNGLGLALLRHAFRTFQACGLSKAGLGVDAHSLTGATRLYERAGMRAFRQWDIYEKELRPGIDLTTQSI
ncbi:MAG: GNAT family N-acetyltransferase [Ktedonobacterales bacterium]